MTPGPLPDPNRRRRNAPTIPTTNLPAGGYTGEMPVPPEWVDLGEAGLAWWAWAWRTPQAAAWSPGDDCMIARRASLEDDLRIQNQVDSMDFFDALNAEEAAAVKQLIGRLAALASGRLAICKEMRELDNLLGLTPKGMAALRWKIVPDPKAKETAPSTGGNVASLDDRRARLTANA